MSVSQHTSLSTWFEDTFLPLVHQYGDTVMLHFDEECADLSQSADTMNCEHLVINMEGDAVEWDTAQCLDEVVFAMIRKLPEVANATFEHYAGRFEITPLNNGVIEMVIAITFEETDIVTRYFKQADDVFGKTWERLRRPLRNDRKLYLEVSDAFNKSMALLSEVMMVNDLGKQDESDIVCEFNGSADTGTITDVFTTNKADMPNVNGMMLPVERVLSWVDTEEFTVDILYDLTFFQYMSILSDAVLASLNIDFHGGGWCLWRG